MFEALETTEQRTKRTIIRLNTRRDGANFQLRRLDIADPLRVTAPSVHHRDGRKDCEVVCGTGLSDPATVKLGYPDDASRVFGIDLHQAVPLGKIPACSA